MVYAFRWGSQKWKTYSLAAGERYTHSWRLDPGEKVPKATIKYDEMMDSGDYNGGGEIIQSRFIDEELATVKLGEKTSKGATSYWFSQAEDTGDIGMWFLRRHQ